MSLHVPVSTDPHWYKDAIIYELHVRSFFDSNDDGIGDFHGLIQKLDYIQDLGVNTIWLLPFYPSPLRDDGYDIANYQRHQPVVRHAARLPAAAQGSARPRASRLHRAGRQSHLRSASRGFKPHGTRRPDRRSAITTCGATPARSTQARASSSPTPRSPTGRGTRSPSAYLLAPLLQPSARSELRQSACAQARARSVMHFWLDMGVDGLRLDAVPYLIEREGTNCENLPRDARHPETASRAPSTSATPIARCLRKPTSGRQTSARTSATATNATWRITSRSCRACSWRCGRKTRCRSSRSCGRRRISRRLSMGAVPSQSRRADARNGDRRRARLHVQRLRRRSADAAQRRHPPPSGAAARYNRPLIELLNSLLLSMPGSPIIYYGDEIGMGDNVYLGDRNGVRTPMQWTGDRNAGFSRADPPRLFAPPIMDPRVRLPGDQRRGAGALAVIAPQLDAADAGAAAAAPDLGPRHASSRSPPTTARCSRICAKTSSSRCSSSPTWRARCSRCTSTCNASRACTPSSSLATPRCRRSPTTRIF